MAREGFVTPFLTAVGTMCYRQVKRFLRMRSRVVMSFLRPMMWLLFFGLGWSAALRGRPGQEILGGISYLEFLAPGVAMMAVFFSSFFAGTSVIWDREFGFLKELLVAPASRRAIILGRALGDALLALLQGVITFAIASALAGRLNIPGLPVLLLAMFLTAITYACLGSAVGSVVGSVESFQLINMSLALPMFFLSGTVVPLHTAPGWMKMASLVVPLTYGVDAARSASCGLGLMPMWLDLAVLSCLALLSVLLAAKAFERATLA